MVEYLLVVLVCQGTACHWERHERFRSEERCIEAGMALEPPLATFKCVVQATDQIVLPRLRP